MIKGNRLKELRINRGLTQTELGDMLGVTKSTICCYEKETRSPSIENLIDLMNIFDVTSDYFLGTEIVTSLKENKSKNYFLTKEELTFLEELRKNKYVYSVLIEDPLRGIELLDKKIG